MQNTISEIIEEDVIVFDHGDMDRHIIRFGKTYISKPTVKENEGVTSSLFPHEARLRNLTYASPIYVDVYLSINAREDPPLKLNIGEVPVMVKSDFCTLKDLSESELCDVDECIYDEGGYFIVNGSEKALIAQERMSTNQVYVFRKQQPAVYTFSAEIRSQLSAHSRLASQTFIRMMHKKGEKSGGVQVIQTTLPYIKTDVPIFIVFRALGVLADKDIFELIWQVTLFLV
jgi:DNA-directed RNA polymerase II subunit RPB2